MTQPVRIYTHASGAETASGNSGDLPLSGYAALAVDVNLSALVGDTTIIFIWQRKGNDGVYYTLYTSPTLAAADTVSLSIGAGLATNLYFGLEGRLTWTIAGSTPSATFSVSVIGQ